MVSDCLSSDSFLWDKFLKGDSNAYAQIYKRTVQDLYQYGLLFSSDKALIKDCIHDVFVKIHVNRSKLSPTDNVSAYLCIALKHTIINALQLEQRKMPLMDDEVNEICDNTTPESSYMDFEHEAQMDMTIHTIMSKLSLREREIIHYRYIKDMSIDEICAVTDLNYQSVSNVIQRSLKRIRGLFKK